MGPLADNDIPLRRNGTMRQPADNDIPLRRNNIIVLLPSTTPRPAAAAPVATAVVAVAERPIAPVAAAPTAVAEGNLITQC